MKALLARESEGAKTLRYDIIIFRCKCHGRKPVGIYLIDIINNLRNIVRRMRFLGLRADSTWSQVWEEHAQLIHFLERRDKEGAISLIKMHLVNAASYVTSALEAKIKYP